ncbi:uncharacterized protein YcbK (DUF882 family) [Sinorhizobium kostiense]|uniref:Uncharacterized protein YcbK (DUF882 family) n=1 Tax=Sinorhizobium kostiense TaxID=76747 RepID=A0ABS4R5D0_9HYPH|nr:YcbK family protein [Sinorhizobium kostiense]MBP2238085.1 uncharacterized protein YcbK (DUF882 family) [Sinorhizobium kostiense]
MQEADLRCAFLSVGRAAALSVSLLALTSCVSAVAENDPVDSREAQAASSQTPIAEAAEASAADQVGAEAAAPLQEAGAPTMQSEATGLEQGVAMQATALSATSSSIYGQSPPATAVADDAGAPVTGAQPRLNATTNSLFSGQNSTAQPMILPQQGASNEAPANVPAVAQGAAHAAAESDIPSAVPVPVSAKAALAGESPPPLQPALAAAHDGISSDPSEALAEPSPTNGRGTEAPVKSWTLAGLFAAKRKDKPRRGDARNIEAIGKRTIAANDTPKPQIASLAYSSLPGVKMNPLYSLEHADHAAGDVVDQPVQVASLSGLARLAPNGLVLQTEKVETGCFKPALLQMLKTVEHHYGQKVIVTSGLRPIKVNSERQSLHTRCEAADIQIPGVSKWELADYLRNLPGRGGVGTYCHTESVHIDIGPQRDWNWRCRRHKG